MTTKLDILIQATNSSEFLSGSSLGAPWTVQRTQTHEDSWRKFPAPSPFPKVLGDDSTVTSTTGGDSTDSMLDEVTLRGTLLQSRKLRRGKGSERDGRTLFGDTGDTGDTVGGGNCFEGSAQFSAVALEAAEGLRVNVAMGLALSHGCHGRESICLSG
jgi:hypothetical protein